MKFSTFDDEDVSDVRPGGEKQFILTDYARLSAQFTKA